MLCALLALLAVAAAQPTPELAFETADGKTCTIDYDGTGLSSSCGMSIPNIEREISNIKATVAALGDSVGSSSEPGSILARLATVERVVEANTEAHKGNKADLADLADSVSNNKGGVAQNKEDVAKLAKDLEEAKKNIKDAPVSQAIFKASECAEVTIANAGYGRANGIYQLSSSSGGHPQFCKGYDCSNSRLYWTGGWGWGIQTNEHGMHHRYNMLPRGANMDTINGEPSNWELRDGCTYPHGGYHCGRAPMPMFRCTKKVDKNGSKAIDMRSCNNIRVSGAGYGRANGDYRANGGNHHGKGHRQFCKNNNCNDSRIYWTKGWGWGIQTNEGGMHHRYNMVPKEVDTPFMKTGITDWELRDGCTYPHGGIHCGKAPMPRFTCLN